MNAKQEQKNYPEKWHDYCIYLYKFNQKFGIKTDDVEKNRYIF